MNNSTDENKYIVAIQAEASRKFHLAFGLMTIIPLLICIYFATVRIASIDILIGLNGVYFLFIIITALLGLLVGRSVLLGVVRRLAQTSAKLERAVLHESQLNRKLQSEIIMRKHIAEELRRHDELLEELVEKRTNRLKIINQQLCNEIVERKRAVEQLKRTHEKLKQSHQELKAAQLQLIQAAKLDSVGQLAAGVAHEVKNPLATVLQGVEYLSDSLSNKTNGNLRQVIEDIREATERANVIVNGLLDFSAPSELKLRKANINEIIEQSLLFIRHELAASRIEVVKHLPGRLPSINLDNSKIQQVFVNLFLNAIYAMPHRGTLTVTSYTLDKGGLRHLAVDINDTGVGIPEAQLGRIFDPFFTNRKSGKGTGLGLAVTQKIIQLHRGEISVQNEKNGGVKVSLVFHENGRPRT